VTVKVHHVSHYKHVSFVLECGHVIEWRYHKRLAGWSEGVTDTRGSGLGFYCGDCYHGNPVGSRCTTFLSPHDVAIVCDCLALARAQQALRQALTMRERA